MTALCLIAVLLLAASYVGYPLALALFAARGGASPVREPVDDAALPSVALVISAYNESAVIAEKIENSLASDYPKALLSIVVFSDGSDDGTDDIVQRYADRGVVLRRIEGRLGKTHGQNTVVAECHADIIVFSDANTLYRPDAVRQLTLAFEDPTVGCVIGNRRYVGDSRSGSQEGIYEQFENWLKAKESQLGGTIGACGAIYAVRRDDYLALPADRISDFVEPLRLACAGRRVVYAAGAVGEEPLETDFWRELSRKRRIVLRSLNSLWAERSVLCRAPAVAIKVILHKIIRWQTLPLLIVAAVAGLASGYLLLQAMTLLVSAYVFTGVSLLFWLRSPDRSAADLPLGFVGRLVLYSMGVFVSASSATVAFLQGKNQIVWNARS